MSRSCGSVRNFFRQVDVYPEHRRNRAILESMTTAAARQGVRRFPSRIPVVVHILHNLEDDNVSDEHDLSSDRYPTGWLPRVCARCRIALWMRQQRTRSDPCRWVDGSGRMDLTARRPGQVCAFSVPSGAGAAHPRVEPG